MQVKAINMEHKVFGVNWWVAVVFGVMGGGIHYTLQVPNPVSMPFVISLIKPFVTAVICGGGGLLGKMAVGYCMKKFKKK